jgi:hypothetical protein
MVVIAQKLFQEEHINTFSNGQTVQGTQSINQRAILIETIKIIKGLGKIGIRQIKSGKLQKI